MTTTEKKANFARLFPPAVEQLIDRLRILGHKSNRSNYEWNQDLVTRSWVEVAYRFQSAARQFGVNFQVSIDGRPVDALDTSKPFNHG